MNIQSIPLKNLSVSALNVRKNVGDIDQLAASIAHIGLLTPIIVRQNGSPTTFEVVAGQRRYLAAKKLEHEVIPAIVIDDKTDVTALEISLTENFSRTDMDPIEACEAFMAIKATNEETTVSMLADRFGVPSKFIVQCLALADLPEDIRKFAKKQGLSMRLLEALTIAPPTVQKAWLKEAKKGEWGWNDPSRIRNSAIGDKPQVRDNVFDIAEYTGEFVTDLFNDTAYFKDVKQFEELQAAEAERHAEKLREEGWSWVKAYTRQQDAPSIHAFGKSKNKKIAGALVIVEKVYADNKYVGRKIVVHTGLLDPETVRQIERDKKKAAKAEAEGTGSDHDTEAEGGEKPQTRILQDVHAAIARAANAHGVLAVRDHSDLLQIVCDLIADDVIQFTLPRASQEVTEIVGTLVEPFPGTRAMGVKMKPSERVMLLRKMLSCAATEVQLSSPPIDNIRKVWNPGENYFAKLDKERLAVCCEDIGLTDTAAGLRNGKNKRAFAVNLLTKVFEGSEKHAPSKVIKAAASWVPKEFSEAQEAREYHEAEEE